MLNLLARQVRGLAVSSAPSTSSNTATTTCARCRVHRVHHAPPSRSAAASIHTSRSAQWRSRDERSDALHSRDADDDHIQTDRRSRRPPRFDQDTRSPARRYGRKDTPRSFEQTTPSKTRMQRGRPDASYPPPEHEHDYPPENDGYAHEEYTPRPERPSKNPYKQQMQRGKLPPVREFEQAQPPRRKYQEGTTKEEITKVETKDKIKAAIDAAKDLPPLTDEDYHEIYQELLTYDPPPPSPTQTRLALAAASSSHTPLLLGNASQPARDRISELLSRLQKRVPAMDIPLASSSVQAEETLSEKLQRLRTPSTTSEVRDDGTSDSNALSNLLGENTPSASAVSSSTSSSAVDVQGTTRPREHTRTRGTIFHALSVLLRPTPGVKDDSSEKKLIIGEQPIGDSAVRTNSNLATKQEWAALLLESASDLNLADVLTTLELMKRAGVAVSEDQLAATIRLLTKDQKLVHVFLRFFEQNEIALPLSAHHEIVLGILRSLEADALPTRAERYLRALEVAGTPALSITYAAVISHIFHSRRETGVRARAWNLFGHMRLVAHPTPSTEVYDAMIYGCSLDDRVSPERALDLFNEMLEAGITPSYNTYLGLIRSCARDKTKGDSPFYFESLRLLKELLERGFQPERDIFNCILEGARSRGDLARAKWIVANMVQIASRQLNPSESPLSPDGKIIQNLFLTAATFKIHDGASNMIKKNLLQDADTIPESVKVPDEDKQGIFLEADEAEEVKEDSPYVIEDRGPASEAGNRGDAHSHIPALHPLFRLQVPTSNEQLLEDCKVILGSILEVHGLPSGILESKMSGTEESGVLGNHDSRQTMTTTSSEPDYCDGLDDNVKAALLNVPIGNAVLNAYLTLLSSHDTSHSVYNFFRQGFSSLGVKYSYQSWEIMFGTLDASTKQKDQAVREWKCVVSDELFSEWQGWIEYILRNAKRPPAWMYRHIETVYARHMGVHARARQMDQAMDIIRDFVARFPPEHITPAVKSLSSMNSAGPDYLVKLSSALYPETMDTSFGGEHSAEYSSSNKKNIAIPRKSMPKSGLNSFNYFGIPPMLNYQMVYSTFHRFREEEDSRAVEILRLLHEYRMALDEAREIRKEMEIVSYKRGERSARREIIGLPGDKRMRFTVPKVSEALQEPTQEQEQERRADSLPDIEDGKLGDVRR